MTVNLLNVLHRVEHQHNINLEFRILKTYSNIFLLDALIF